MRPSATEPSEWITTDVPTFTSTRRMFRRSLRVTGICGLSDAHT